jgi:uncharacterized repeat protein (TIGR03809 family)
MAHQQDVARGRDVLARWCDLAEARLDYLTELFETGRWRRYHSELSFLENIQEAKAAVETWRDLSTREASRNNAAVDISWLGHTASLPRGETPRVQPMWSEPPAPEIATAADTKLVYSDDAPSAPDEPDLDTPDLDAPAMELVSDDRSELTRGIAAAIAERYPQLRNAM